MSRRSNLNTIRRGFKWDSDWTTFNSSYTQVLWFDIKITAFLQGLFYVLRLPSSSYIIRRFLNSFVIIETDVWLFHKPSFTYFLPNQSHFSYVVYKVRELLFKQNKKRKKLFGTTKLFSINSIVYHFLNRRRFVLQKKRNISKRKVCAFDANTIKKRDVNMYDLDMLDILGGSKWVRPGVQPHISNASIMLLWNNKQTVRTWQRASLGKLCHSNSYRYVLFSRRFYLSYINRYFTSNLGRFVRWAAKRRTIKQIPSISAIFSTFTQYSQLFRRFCICARLAYISRSLLNIRFAFRLLCFYATNSVRSLLFRRFSSISTCTTHSKLINT